MKVLILFIAMLMSTWAISADMCADHFDSDLNEVATLRYGDATCSAMKNFPDGDHPKRSYSVSEKSYNLETAIKKLAATCDDIVFNHTHTRVKCFKVVCEYNCTEMYCEKKEVDLTPYFKHKPTEKVSKK